MNSWYIDRKSWHRYYRVSIIFSEVLSRGFARCFGDFDYQSIYSSPLIIRSSVFNICRTLFLPHKVELQSSIQNAEFLGARLLKNFVCVIGNSKSTCYRQLNIQSNLPGALKWFKFAPEFHSFKRPPVGEIEGVVWVEGLVFESTREMKNTWFNSSAMASIANETILQWNY